MAICAQSSAFKALRMLRPNAPAHSHSMRKRSALTQ